MREAPPAANGPEPLSRARRVDEACYRFEAAWKAASSSDRRPRIEDYLADTPALERPELLRELILLDVFYRRRRAEDPRPDDYHNRFPLLDMKWLEVAVTARLVGKRLGDFEIVRELGRGGMGVVYEARQVSLNRQVALKVLSAGLGLTPKAVQRFRREAEAAAKLHHTNIVPVYATGEEDGTHFYAMELIDGPSLDHVIRQMRQASRERPSPLATSHPGPDAANAPRAPDLKATGPYVPEAGSEPTLSASSLSSDSHYFDTVARMVAEVADALDYAHRQGVIHRDIKPSNLLLAPAGRLSLNDFGLARMLGQPGMTMSGEFVGSPLYMSPEQITAGRTLLDHRTDIYSLGATLYELLTLQPPFSGSSRDQVLTQILHKEPKAPRKVNKKVPVDLDTICLKCLEKDPDRRYQSAGDLAEDLRRYVNRFGILARRAGPVTRLGKWVRRHPGLAAALSCVAVLALVAAFAAYQAHQAERERLAERARAREQLLAEKRQNALDKALLVAMSGDFTEAEKAIVDAELFGASIGQVRMLRGQLAFHRGEYEEALQHLQQAVKLIPDSVAARAMLTTAFDETGEFGRYMEMVVELERLSPITSEDYLFKGQAEYGRVPVQALQLIDEAIRLRDSTVARVIRAEVRAAHALNTANLADAELAVQDASVAKAMLPNNPVALWVSVYAHLVAAGTYNEMHQEENSRAALAQAERDARTLERFPTLASAAVNRSIYLQYVDQDDAALEVLRRATEQSNHYQLFFRYAMALYQRGDFKTALQVLDRRGKRIDLVGDVLRAYLLAELPDGPARALETYQDMAARYTAGFGPLYTQTVLRFLGRKVEAVAASRVFFQQADQSGPFQSGYARRLLEYQCDLLSEAALLKAAGTSKCAQGYGHYFIALTKLAEGDRVGARKHFQKCMASRFFTYWGYDWSRMFLARMAQDPNWPPWIPVKQ